MPRSQGALGDSVLIDVSTFVVRADPVQCKLMTYNVSPDVLSAGFYMLLCCAGLLCYSSVRTRSYSQKRAQLIACAAGN